MCVRRLLPITELAGPGCGSKRLEGRDAHLAVCMHDQNAASRGTRLVDRLLLLHRREHSKRRLEADKKQFQRTILLFFDASLPSPLPDGLMVQRRFGLVRRRPSIFRFAGELFATVASFFIFALCCTAYTGARNRG